MIEFYHHDPSMCEGEASPVNEWLGNFHLVKGRLQVGSESYATSEAAFQAQKCFYIFSSNLKAQQQCLADFQRAKDGEAAFQVSKKYRIDAKTQEGQVWIGPGRDQAMLRVLRAKFPKTDHPELNAALCSTGNIPLLETIPEYRASDLGVTHWGKTPSGKGQNVLGLQLMQVRSEVCK